MAEDRLLKGPSEGLHTRNLSLEINYSAVKNLTQKEL